MSDDEAGGKVVDLVTGQSVTFTPDRARGNRPGGIHPESPAARRAAAKLREMKTLDMRAAGHSFASIAAELGYSDKSAAKKAYDRALASEWDARSETRTKLRTEQNLRLNALLRAVWPSAMLGDDKMVDQARKLLERQAKLNGLDEPIRVHVEDEMDSMIDQAIQDLLEQGGEGS